MMRQKALKPLFISAAVAAGAVAENDCKEKVTTNKYVCRRSELPIYNPCRSTPAAQPETALPEPGIIESGVRQLRLQLVKGYDKFETFKIQAENTVQSVWGQSEEFVSYLQKEDNTLPRYGAIAIGGLAGFILGLRGGIIKKALYTTLGAGAIASVCYPEEAQEYGQQAISEGKKYATIAYNFAYGVKKGDPIQELPSLPKLPGSFSEAWDLASNLGKAKTTESDASKAPKSDSPNVSGGDIGGSSGKEKK